jgi:seryl-tRNA synthetase
LKIDETRRALIQETEQVRAQQKSLSDKVATLQGAERENVIVESKKIKEVFVKKSEELEEVEGHLGSLLLHFPNIPFSHVVAGGEENNVELRKEGTIPKFSFPVQDHLQIAERLGIIDIERAAKVSGSRFAYLKNEGALLQLALVSFVVDKARAHGFVPIVPPALITTETMSNMGYIDTQEDMAERYLLDREGLFLVGTGEQSVVPMHQGETFASQDLPKRYVAFSPCFREEAGSYGKDTRGIIRLHQFSKVELVSYASQDASQEEHKFLVALEESIWKDLEIPYRVMQLAAGDMSRPAAECIDIEAWIPSQNEYREVSSASNTTDFQARRLNIRVRGKEGKTEFAHILNATGLPVERAIVAILENYQQKDGSVHIPKALFKYLSFKKIG